MKLKSVELRRVNLRSVEPKSVVLRSVKPRTVELKNFDLRSVEAPCGDLPPGGEVDQLEYKYATILIRPICIIGS